MSAILKPLPENLRSVAREMETIYRELPRLLSEGEEGRFALVRGDEVFSVWDTWEDAVQAGYDKFGWPGNFIAQPIETADLERLASYFGTLRGAAREHV